VSVGAVVLCGGESGRMGRPKAWLPFGGSRHPHPERLAAIRNPLAKRWVSGNPDFGEATDRSSCLFKRSVSGNQRWVSGNPEVVDADVLDQPLRPGGPVIGNRLAIAPLPLIRCLTR
jgi:CTP:molybdopterin cytidylyltransferase MocA